MKDRFSRIPPGPLFLLGLLTVPAFLFQEGTIYRILESLLFLSLCVLSGKRIRPLPGIILLASVILANLLVPYGRVLFSVIGLPVTSGALEEGLSRGILLLGLLYLSKFSVRRGFIFPGRIGDGIGKIFYYFERFSESREKVSLRDLSGSLDNLLISVSVSVYDGPDTDAGMQPNRFLLLVPLMSAVFCWVLLFV